MEVWLWSMAPLRALVAPSKDSAVSITQGRVPPWVQLNVLKPPLSKFS